MNNLLQNKRIGLGLGGGAVLGAAHIGVLRALEEQNISVDCIAGTSIGALISAFFAFGKTSEEIEEILTDVDWLDVSGIALSQYGLLTNTKLGELVCQHIGNVSFDQASVPLALVAADISSGEKVVLTEGKVRQAVMASSCIPGVFVPVEIDDKFLVDGGIVENVPITPLRMMNADFIIGVDLNVQHCYTRPENIVEILLNAFDFTLVCATKLQTQDADLLITPDLSSFNLIDTNQVADLIEKGYAEAMKACEKIVNG